MDTPSGIVEQLFSGFFLLTGVSLIVQNTLWTGFIKWLYSSDENTFKYICLISGILLFPVSLCAFLKLDVWSFFNYPDSIWNPNLTPAFILTTFFTALFLTKCVLLSLWPGAFVKYIRWFSKKDVLFFKWYLRVAGILYVVLAGVLLATL